NPRGEESKRMNFVVSDGTEASLRMKFQGNGMWRLQMTNEVPEVARGLRPVLPDGKLGRSPWVAVFERTVHEDTYNLRFVQVRSKAFEAICQRSSDHGTY